MRPVITFFLLLCLQLFGGFTSIASSVRTSNISCFSTHQTTKQSYSNVNPNQDNFLVNTERTGDQSNFLISLEDKDEDEDCIKKQAAVVTYFLVFSYPNLVNHFFGNKSTTSSSFGNLATYYGCPLYISHRVLRI